MPVELVCRQIDPRFNINRRITITERGGIYRTIYESNSLAVEFEEDTVRYVEFDQVKEKPVEAESIPDLISRLSGKWECYEYDSAKQRQISQFELTSEQVVAVAFKLRRLLKLT